MKSVVQNEPHEGVLPMAYRSKVRTCLWFERGGLQAAEFYVSLAGGIDQRVDAGPG